ncbi:9428_t:CDS:1, partial [Cetraspora pellucida]
MPVASSRPLKSGGYGLFHILISAQAPIVEHSFYSLQKFRNRTGNFVEAYESEVENANKTSKWSWDNKKAFECHH